LVLNWPPLHSRTPSIFALRKHTSPAALLLRKQNFALDRCTGSIEGRRFAAEQELPSNTIENSIDFRVGQIYASFGFEAIAQEYAALNIGVASSGPVFFHWS